MHIQTYEGILYCFVTVIPVPLQNKKRIWHTLVRAAFVGKTIHFPILTLSTLEKEWAEKVSCMHTHEQTNKHTHINTRTPNVTSNKANGMCEQTLQVNGKILLQIFINFGIKQDRERS